VRPPKLPSRKTFRNSTRWLAATLFASLLFAPTALAQAFFYNEVVKDGRIYVFAVPAKSEAFARGGGTDTSPAIERRAYGPRGETVVFDSEDAINLYNFKHGLPGEAFARPGDTAAPQFPSHKISGLMFGDYYWYYDRHQDGTSSDDAAAVKGQHGLWFRRLYFTYDFAASDRLTTRFRLEANSDGQFEGGDIVPYVKDGYIRWTFAEKQRLTLGIHPTLTFDWLEGLWGLRHIEKTPADLYRLDSSRDFGITVDGSAPVRGLVYAAQFGNESGAGSETREGKILRFETRYGGNVGLALEGFYSFGTGPSGENRHTAQGIGGFQRDRFRAGPPRPHRRSRIPSPLRAGCASPTGPRPPPQPTEPRTPTAGRTGSWSKSTRSGRSAWPAFPSSSSGSSWPCGSPGAGSAW